MTFENTRDVRYFPFRNCLPSTTCLLAISYISTYMSSVEGEGRGRGRLGKAEEGRKRGSLSIANWEITYVTRVFKNHIIGSYSESAVISVSN